MKSAAPRAGLRQKSGSPTAGNEAVRRVRSPDAADRLGGVLTSDPSQPPVASAARPARPSGCCWERDADSCRGGLIEAPDPLHGDLVEAADDVRHQAHGVGEVVSTS